MTAARPYDRLLLLATLALVGLGLLMVYSSTAVVTPVMERKNITEFFYLKKHSFTLLIGLAAMFVAYRADREMLRRMAIPLMLISLVLLLLCLSRGWASRRAARGGGSGYGPPRSSPRSW